MLKNDDIMSASESNENLFSIFAVMTDIVFGKDYRKERITA